MRIHTANFTARTFARADADAGAGVAALARFPLLPPPSDGRFADMIAVEIVGGIGDNTLYEDLSFTPYLANLKSF